MSLPKLYVRNSETRKFEYLDTRLIKNGLGEYSFEVKTIFGSWSQFDTNLFRNKEEVACFISQLSKGTEDQFKREAWKVVEE